MNRKPRNILIILLIVVGAFFAIVASMFYQFGGLNFVHGMDNKFGDQHLKTAVALIELHKLRTGSYPGDLSELKFAGEWDQIALNSVKYTPHPERSEYFIEVQRGWVSKPNFEMPKEFWKGTGYNPKLNLYLEEVKYRKNLMEIVKVADSAILFSIDPVKQPRADENTFNQYKVINKKDLSHEDLGQVGKSFLEYMANESQKIEMACFNPHHGLRLIEGNHQYDFIVCFECKKMQIIDADKTTHEFSFSGNPDVLDSILGHK